MSLKRTLGHLLLWVAAILTILAAGCNKEKIVNSTEYVHDIQYVQSPPDTVLVRDTIYRSDSIIVNTKDTIRIRDTVRTTDTIRVTNTVHDTVRVTSIVHDTVRVTSVVHDTVLKSQCSVSSQMAVDAMISQADPLILDFLMQQVGQNDGWVFHLSPSQMTITQVSTTVWDIGSVVDYWAADWSGYYQIDMLWRMTFTGGDASNPANWTMGDPPATSRYRPGLNPQVKSATPEAMRITPRE